MARMRSAKQKLRECLLSQQWREHLDEIAQGGLENVGPLFSFLLLGPLTMHRAAVALGQITALLAKDQPETAKNIVRRLMWHLNEESGNIGWGIPEAFAEILAASEPLAKDFHRILISYIIDLGRDDNYCDNDTLRRSCYWAIGRLAQARPQLCLTARQWLLKGLEDEDMVCRGMMQCNPQLSKIADIHSLPPSSDVKIFTLFVNSRKCFCCVCAQPAIRFFAHKIAGHGSVLLAFL